MFLHPRDSCISCPADPPQCSPKSCAANESCAVTSRVCALCPQTTCIAKASQYSPKPGGASKAALAGAVVGALIFLAAVLGVVWYLHRCRKARKLAERKVAEPPPEVPASAADVLRREDPHEKSQSTSNANSNNTRVYDAQSVTTINLDPKTAHAADDTPQSISRTDIQSSLRNPFGDQSTLGSNRTEETHQNDIQIAMVPYGSVQSPGPQSSNQPNSPTSAKSNTPSRPARAPDVNLRLDNSTSPYDLSHVNVSDDSFPKSGIPASVRSGMTAGSRASYLSTGTYATDLLNGESSTVVIRQQGKIIGLSRAQVVTAPVGTTPSGTPLSSPLTSSHLLPTDRRMSRITIGRSPLAQSSFTPDDIPEDQVVNSPFADSHAAPSNSSPALGSNLDTRSVRTTASGWNDSDSVASGIEASISSARRVIIRSDGRFTSPLVSPASGSHSQYGASSAHRMSFASEASSRADSILEAFPFVPPSLPPSPMTIQTFRSALSNHARTPQPKSPLSLVPGDSSTDDEELVPPDRRGQGVSVYSAKSSVSSGLGGYPVELHIDSPSSGGRSPLPSRASLDTLALSRDLSAFPLAFDEAKMQTHNNFQPQPGSSGAAK